MKQNETKPLMDTLKQMSLKLNLSERVHQVQQGPMWMMGSLSQTAQKTNKAGVTVDFFDNKSHENTKTKKCASSLLSSDWRFNL